MDIIARSNTERISSRKVMLVADLIRGKSVKEAIDMLTLIRKRGGDSLEKVIKSAVANAVNNFKQNKDLLFIKKLEVTQGPFLKRARASTKGRQHLYKKRTTHIKIILEEKNPNTKIRNPKQTQMTEIQNSK